MSDVGEPRRFSDAWAEHCGLWELEMIGTPGLFDVECNLDAADWQRLSDRAAFLRREDGEK